MLSGKNMDAAAGVDEDETSPSATTRTMRDAGDRTVSRLRVAVNLAQHFVDGVDDRLRLIQLNVVT